VVLVAVAAGSAGGAWFLPGRPVPLVTGVLVCGRSGVPAPVRWGPGSGGAVAAGVLSKFLILFLSVRGVRRG
jgi:hypothetical protein